ncbi:hypothetical protein [Clostridium sardiniense]|uniref:hypothetical protein n=1 Tax=Clostridium sardiniense TaxID=29369 RepID=UPI00195ACFD5|nr:hypothetical protein [Clostridium sardiniense]MBM7835751.1 hypothetical protein [Clostridium sardiniense]
MQVVRNYNDANILLSRGHKLLKIDRDKNNRKYLIFLFKRTNGLMEDLKEITK